MPEIRWIDNTGRNGWDSPFDVGPKASVEARNVTFYRCGLGRQRGGSVSLTITGVTAPINAMFEFIPAQDPTAAELYVVDSSATTKILRCAGGSTFSNLTLKDTVQTTPTEVSAVPLNGKLYLAHDSSVNRLHVYDPGFSTTQVRRAGFATPAAPTVANTGVGGYSASLRYYRVRWLEVRSSVVIRQSLSSPSQSFTPSGTGTAARVTQPTVAGEGETHWMVEGSTDNALFYDISGNIAIASTTYDDSASPAGYSANTAAPSAGANTPFPSVKWLCSTGTRLVGFGVWESSAGDSLAPKSGRVYFGPALDSSSVNDDERINNTTSLVGTIDLARNSGAVDRGLVNRPVNNVIYAFQSQGIYGLLTTDDATGIQPFRRVQLHATIGAVNNQSIVVASLNDGQQAAFFLDPTVGPYTLGGRWGTKWVGKDVKDIWDTFNRDATTLAACGEWFPDRNCVLWAIATSGSNTPNFGIGLDVTQLTIDEAGDLRGGWFTWDGDFVTLRSLRLFSNTLAASRSSTKTLYAGAATKLLRYDESVNADDTTPFQAYVTSGVLAEAEQALMLRKAYVRASAQTATTVQLSITRNFGDETNRTSTVDLTPVGSQTAVLRKFEDAAMQDGDAIQFTVGDATAVASTWVIYTVSAQIEGGSEA